MQWQGSGTEQEAEKQVQPKIQQPKSRQGTDQPETEGGKPHLSIPTGKSAKASFSQNGISADAEIGGGEEISKDVYRKKAETEKAVKVQIRQKSKKK